MKVIYSKKQVSDPGKQLLGEIESPSARKPRELAAVLTHCDIPVEFVEPEPVSIEDIKRVHDPCYVDDILRLKRANGFGTFSQSVVDSLPYTIGAMYTAAKLATPESPTCALVSGFHHAGYSEWEKFGWFCTFNGLMVTAAKLLAEGKKVIIIDCDMHWGNGTHDILCKLPDLSQHIAHFSFGRRFHHRKDADLYLKSFEEGGGIKCVIENVMRLFRPDVVLYQAGADVHVDDPYGGLLTTEEMYERDYRMFVICKKLGIPVVWNLAGGYQVEPDGSIKKVLDLHLNTFKAAYEVYFKENRCR